MKKSTPRKFLKRKKFTGADENCTRADCLRVIPPLKHPQKTKPDHQIMKYLTVKAELLYPFNFNCDSFEALSES